MEFPRLVYKSASEHALVEDKEQFDAKIKDGWFASVTEAIAGKAEASVETKTYSDDTIVVGAPPLPDLSPAQQDAADNVPPTRAELEQKATELSIQFSPNIGDRKLVAKIEKALKG